VSSVWHGDDGHKASAASHSHRARDLARLDTRPQDERDRMAVAGLRKRLLASGRIPIWRVDAVARSIFEKHKKRASPASEAA
jgi:hypothetical protein